MRDIENLINLSYKHFKKSSTENPFEFDCHCNKYEKKEGVQKDEE